MEKLVNKGKLTSNRQPGENGHKGEMGENGEKKKKKRVELSRGQKKTSIRRNPQRVQGMTRA